MSGRSGCSEEREKVQDDVENEDGGRKEGRKTSQSGELRTTGNDKGSLAEGSIQNTATCSKSMLDRRTILLKQQMERERKSFPQLDLV